MVWERSSLTLWKPKNPPRWSLEGGRTVSSPMIVDDGRVFPAPDHVDHRAGSVADLPAGPHGGDTSIRLLNEQVIKAPWPPPSAEDGDRGDDDPVQLLDEYGHRRRAQMLDDRNDLSDLWHDREVDDDDDDRTVSIGQVIKEPHAIVGPYAASGPILSPAARASMRASLEHDAPDAVLMELRALARKPNQTGISAWRTFRDRERSMNINK